MKMHLISDNNDTLTGLRLVGINGTIVHTQQEIKHALDTVLRDKDIGLLLINEKLAKEFTEILDDIKLNRKLPLVVEIPDRHGLGRTPDFITSYIKEAIGVKF